jgi:hypothetical protein
MTQMLIDVEKERLEKAAKRGNRPIRLLDFRLPRLKLWFRPAAPKLQRKLK